MQEARTTCPLTGWPWGAGECGTGNFSHVEGALPGAAPGRPPLPPALIGGNGKRPCACSDQEPQPQAGRPLRMPVPGSPARRRCALCACPVREPCPQAALSHWEPGRPSFALGKGQRVRWSRTPEHSSSIRSLRSKGGAAFPHALLSSCSLRIKGVLCSSFSELSFISCINKKLKKKKT